jgi:valyl-tRNA synthetase
MGSTPGNDSRYSAEKIESKRNFINKLWNISRYILGGISSDTNLKSDAVPVAKTLSDRWILSELISTRVNVKNRLENFEFSLAAEELTDFTWNKLADWYLEIAKIEKDKDAILVYLLKNILIMWHPFIPYVTETIWEQLDDGLLLVKQWPQDNNFVINEEAVLKINSLQEIIISIRNARQENKIEPGRKIKALIYAGDNQSFLEEVIELIKNLKTGISDLEIKSAGEVPNNSIAIAIRQIDIYLLDAVDAEKEQARLIKEKENLEKVVSSLKARLDNEEFVARAPKNIVEAEQEKLNGYLLELEKINKLII